MTWLLKAALIGILARGTMMTWTPLTWLNPFVFVGFFELTVVGWGYASYKIIRFPRVSQEPGSDPDRAPVDADALYVPNDLAFAQAQAMLVEADPVLQSGFVGEAVRQREAQLAVIARRASADPRWAAGFSAAMATQGRDIWGNRMAH